MRDKCNLCSGAEDVQHTRRKSDPCCLDFPRGPEAEISDATDQDSKHPFDLRFLGILSPRQAIIRFWPVWNLLGRLSPVQAVLKGRVL